MNFSFYALFLVAILLVFILWYVRHMNQSSKRHLWVNIKEAKEVLQESFGTLRRNMEEQFKFLRGTEGKRGLAKEEEARVMKQLNKDLNDAEKFIRKEIEDIEKEVK